MHHIEGLGNLDAPILTGASDSEKASRWQPRRLVARIISALDVRAHPCKRAQISDPPCGGQARAVC
jgi:hypothetical protein